MTKPDFRATWVPRIGEEATAELRRFRKIGGFAIAAPLFAGAAGLLFARNGTLDSLLAVGCSAIGISFLVAFFNGRKRLAEAMSYWFGVRIKIPPPMSVRRFDSWRKERGLRSPDERADGPIKRVPLESMTLINLGLPSPPELWPGEQMLWSGIGYASQPKGWLEGMIYVTSGRVMFAPARISPFTISGAEVQRFQRSDLLSVELENQSSAPDAGKERQRLVFTFQGGGSLLVAVEKPDEAIAELRALLSVHQGV